MTQFDKKLPLVAMQLVCNWRFVYLDRDLLRRNTLFEDHLADLYLRIWSSRLFRTSSFSPCKRRHSLHYWNTQCVRC